ncbi:hypothetical protein A2U01_0072291, partial [Trifolium medium]|nr:hypothetical protein [Trifolium medium]
GKISVNLSRFQRPEGNKRGADRSVERKRNEGNGMVVQSSSRPANRNDQSQLNHSHFNAAERGNYAQAVMKGGAASHG